jgi:hypothetical protein
MSTINQEPISQTIEVDTSQKKVPTVFVGDTVVLTNGMTWTVTDVSKGINLKNEKGKTRRIQATCEGNYQGGNQLRIERIVRPPVTALATVEHSSQLANLERAKQMLAEYRTLPEIKKSRDIAEAAKVYARAAHLGRESQNYAAEIALLASRKAGEILSQLQKTPKQSAASIAGDSEYRKTLNETHTPERTAQEWQVLAKIPEETFSEYVQQSKDLKTEISRAGLLKVAKKAENRNCPSPVVPLQKREVSAADLRSRLTVLLSEIGALNAFTKQLKYLDMDEPSKQEVQTLIAQLRKVSKDAAERADRLQAAMEKVAV